MPETITLSSKRLRQLCESARANAAERAREIRAAYIAAEQRRARERGVLAWLRRFGGPRELTERQAWVRVCESRALDASFEMRQIDAIGALVGKMLVIAEYGDPPNVLISELARLHEWASARPVQE